MQPIHSIEYEMTTQLASEIHHALARRELRRGWRRDVPTFAGAAGFAMLIIVLGVGGWLMPVYAAGLLCLVMLFVMGALFRRWSVASGAGGILLLALQTSDRRIRVEFDEERVRLETEFYRGEGTWAELDEIVIFPGFWVLYLSNGGQVLIPVSLLSEELEAFLRDRARQATAPLHQG